MTSGGSQTTDTLAGFASEIHAAPDQSFLPMPPPETGGTATLLAGASLSTYGHDGLASTNDLVGKSSVSSNCWGSVSRVSCQPLTFRVILNRFRSVALRLRDRSQSSALMVWICSGVGSDSFGNAEWHRYVFASSVLLLQTLNPANRLPRAGVLLQSASHIRLCFPGAPTRISNPVPPASQQHMIWRPSGS